MDEMELYFSKLAEINHKNSENDKNDDSEDSEFESDETEPVSKRFKNAISKPNTYINFLKNLEDVDWEVNDNEIDNNENSDFSDGGDYEEETLLDINSEDSGDELNTAAKENDTFEEKEIQEQNNVVYNLMSQKLRKLRERFIIHCAQIPILGFNSSSYDINLIKHELIHCFNFCDSKDAFIVKKGNK